MSKILNYINDGQWEKALKSVDNLFDIVYNGKNIFHYACTRGMKDVINQYIDLNSDLIYLSDGNGNSGAHLLALNDFDEILIDIINKKSEFLKLINENDEYIYDLVIEKYDILYKIIEIMLKNKYYDNLNHVKNSGESLILKIIDYSEENNDYFKILKLLDNKKINWGTPKDNPPIMYAISEKKYDTVKYIIDNLDINLNIRNSDSYNPLIGLILNKKYDIVEKLLDKNIDINFSGAENKFVPLSLLFKYKQYKLAKRALEYDNIIIDNNDSLLNTPIYYLIENMNDKSDKLEMDILKSMIEKSDLTNLNINHVTPFHLLVQNKLWKFFKKELAKKHIDINITDKYGNSPISTIDSTESDEFISFIDTEITNNITISTLEENNIVLPISIKSDFGLFNSDGIHSTLYLLYILKEHPNCMMPLQTFNEDKYLWDMYIVIHEKSQQDAITNLMTSLVGFYTQHFFTFMPCLMLWRDKYYYHVYDDIKIYLKRLINCEKIRFIVLKLSLIVHSSTIHANIVIYDKLKNKLIRFEPYGDWEFLDSYFLDKKILKIFTKVIDSENIKSLKYIRPSEYLSKTKFQSVSLGDHSKNKNLGDPDGYCLAWCYWFLELKLKNQDIDETKLVEMALKKIIENDSYLENPLLNYIRGYAKHLDDEKNKIFEKIEISKDNYYNLYYNDENLSKIKNFIRINTDILLANIQK